MDSRNANPEEAAVTGGVPAAAEPPPTTRGRRSSQEGFLWVSLLVGVVLLVTALVADQESGPAMGTAVAGLALIGLAILSFTGHVGPATGAVVAFCGGLLLTVVALTASGFGVAQAVLLGAGAFCFIGSFASLAANRRHAAGSGDAEPGAGVENV